MVDILYSLDVAVFHFINQTIANPLFDKFFSYITEVKNWYLVYIILWLTIFIKGGRKGKIAALFALLLITASDQFSSAFLKNLIQRVRPCNFLDDVRIVLGCTGSFSFPSSHAVNNFAIATFFAILYPKYKWALFISAFLVAFSRPYIGVHYPSDMVGGAIIGIIFGFLFSFFVTRIDKYLNSSKKVEEITKRFKRIK